jgi:hypothetical protein
MVLMASIGWFVGVLALLALSLIWRGYVLAVLWGWFAVPTFGLPELALAPAMGLSLVVSFLTYQIDATKKQEGSEMARFTKAAAHSLLMPALALGVGWVVHQFV